MADVGLGGRSTVTTKPVLAMLIRARCISSSTHRWKAEGSGKHCTENTETWPFGTTHNCVSCPALKVKDDGNAVVAQRL